MPKDVRGSAQNVYGTFVIGLGVFAGGFISGWIAEYFTVAKGVQDWVAIWLSSAAIAVVCLVAFLALFPKEAEEVDRP